MFGVQEMQIKTSKSVYFHWNDSIKKPHNVDVNKLQSCTATDIYIRCWYSRKKKAGNDASQLKNCFTICYLPHLIYRVILKVTSGSLLSRADELTLLCLT